MLRFGWLMISCMHVYCMYADHLDVYVYQQCCRGYSQWVAVQCHIVYCIDANVVDIDIIGLYRLHAPARHIFGHHLCLQPYLDVDGIQDQ